MAKRSGNGCEVKAVRRCRDEGGLSRFRTIDRAVKIEPYLLVCFVDVDVRRSNMLAFTQRTTTWRGTEFVLTRDGRLQPKESATKG